MRSRLLLPIETVSVHLQLLATPFINKSLQLGTSQLLSKNNKQNPICIWKFSPSVYSLSPFTASFFFFFKLPSIAFCSLLLPFTTPTLLFNSLLLQPQQGQTTDSLLCVNLTEKQCVCVCACLYWEHFFLNLQHSFGSGGQAFSECERGDPRGAVIWLNKQPDSERYLLQRAPGTAEINLRLWTSEGSIHLRQQPL